MTSSKRIISNCPFCSGDLRVSKLTCETCDTQIESSLPIPTFFRMPQDLQEFVVVFLRLRGNIREMEKELGVSYPTVCKRLDQVNQFLSGQTGRTTPALNPREILEQVERGEITAAEAARMLKEG